MNIQEDEHRPEQGDSPFNKKSFNLPDHVSPYDNANVNTGVRGIEVELVQGIDEENFKRTLSMAVRATKGVDLSDGLPDYGDDWEEMLQGGLQTALETQVVVFAVSGVSRTCTHQLVRSRRASFHQQSQRASYMGDHPEVRIPQSVWEKGHDVRLAWLDAIQAAHRAYRVAAEHDVAFQDCRFILPEGTTTFIMLEYPLREFLAVYEYRACFMFQWEIREVMHKCAKVLVEAHPWMEPYVKITCEKTNGAKDTFMTGSYEQQKKDQKRGHPDAFKHTCRFQGWEQVEGHCPFAWARETNREFRSKRHEIKPS